MTRIEKLSKRIEKLEDEKQRRTEASLRGLAAKIDVDLIGCKTIEDMRERIAVKMDKLFRQLATESNDPSIRRVLLWQAKRAGLKLKGDEPMEEILDRIDERWAEQGRPRGYKRDGIERMLFFT